MSLPQAARTTDAGAFRLVAGEGGLAAQGPLNFATARHALELGMRALADARPGTVEIDCGGITVGDSAGLAVLLEWLGAAKQARRGLRYTHLPAGLAALARISEVQELLERGV